MPDDTSAAQQTRGSDTFPIRKPTTAAELRALVARAISALRFIQHIEAKRDARIAYYQQKIDDLKNTTFKRRDEKVSLIRKLMPRIEGFIEENRFELTHRGRRKTIGFPDGTFRWQRRTFTDIPDEEAFFKEVRGLNLSSEFIRVKEEPNRRALLDDANEEKAGKLTTARIVEETRPQLVTPGTTLVIERATDEETDAPAWDVLDSRDR